MSVCLFITRNPSAPTNSVKQEHCNFIAACFEAEIRTTLQENVFPFSNDNIIKDQLARFLYMVTALSLRTATF